MKISKDPIGPKIGLPWYVYLFLIIICLTAGVVGFYQKFNHPKLIAVASNTLSISQGGTGFGYSSTNRSLKIALHFYKIKPEPDESEKSIFGISTSMKKDSIIVEDFGTTIFTFEDHGNKIMFQSLLEAVKEGMEKYPTANCTLIEGIKQHVSGWRFGMSSIREVLK